MVCEKLVKLSYMFHLDEATIKRLRFLQRTNKGRRFFIKVTVLLMLHQQYTPEEIANSLGIDDATIYLCRLPILWVTKPIKHVPSDNQRS